MPVVFVIAAALTLIPFTMSRDVDVCLLSNVKSISVPLHAADPKSPRVLYRYQLLGNPNGRKIVFMPGGPGGEAINEWDLATYDQDFAAAKDSQLILMESRGAGCNQDAFDHFPKYTYSTEDIASDARAVIKALKLKEYWIYGVSYGTQSATVLAHQIEQHRDVPPPRGLILSGTVGSGYDNDETQLNAEIKQWNNFDKSPYPNAIATLTSSDEPLGLPSENWLKYLLDGFDGGYLYDQDEPHHRTVEALKILESRNHQDIEELKSDVEDASPDESMGLSASRLYRDIEASEWLRADDPGFTVRPRFVDTKAGTAAESYRLPSMRYPIHRKVNHYDPRNYPVHVPIFYFHGENDTITSIHAFDEHFNAQTATKRFALISKMGGHGALYTSYLLCKDELWKSIFADGHGFADAAKTCKAPTSIRIR